MLNVPPLWPSVLTPPAEVPAIKDLKANLYGVASNVEAWASALRLYAFAKQKHVAMDRKDFWQWRFIACHECGLQLHHLRERMEKIKGYKLAACPSIAPFVNKGELRIATTLLDKQFPNIDQLRHAIAHAGEFDTLPDGHVPAGDFGLVGFRENDRFSAYFEGELRTLGMTDESLAQITKIAARYLGAFEPAAKALELQGHLE
ncbi:hypothetical protein QTH90_00190 [Variovorax sp. J2P1-59]|uniref:hypothetical protein n=1 Tax=Variovorax flavidus TaxID=3053501 RepID=UPI0025789291|nr:hypothetical protein [Variovorax sp. J2P1-59]MDM0072783.1 hypothetical protein [Variovorax sp. J2P1-59]